MKIRIKFCKDGVMKFIGHLDIMRYFQKAMRRAEIDICYSEGFSPHQIMSFAAPLGVGIISEGEYLDIEVASTRSSEASIQALNDTMVEGVRITGYVKLPDNAKTAMSLVAAADYELFFKDGYEAPAGMDEYREAIDHFYYETAEILITKQTKKSERVVDIKPLIYRFKVIEKNGKPAFFLKVSTGSNDNLKPELVLETLHKSMGLTLDENAIQIHRLEIYAAGNEERTFVPLLAMGEEIR